MISTALFLDRFPVYVDPRGVAMQILGQSGFALPLHDDRAPEKMH